MLIKRGVFEKLNAHPAVKPFVNDIGLAAELNPYMKTYFDTAVRENRYYSEDWTFCENWRDIGGKIWVDKRVLLKHTGSYVFDFQAQEPLYRAFQAMDATLQKPQAPATLVQEPVVLASNETAKKAKPKTSTKKK